MLRIAANGSAANGLLGDRLYVSGHDDEQQHEPMTWQSKLKINDVAKLTKFSLSISIPKGETHAVVDYLGGTAEFICPNYFSTFHVMEKVDVYSFGSFLLELLTGRRLGHLAQTAKDEGADLVENIKNLAINEIVKPAILAGGGAGVEQQVQAVLQFALICREQDPEIRPNMIDVTKELRNIERFIP
ncbi:non-functional pseudokinase ZRK2-like [Quercus suber]|uniref:non-functional pseudokinase ZRK2-like n=1 Tax=Quercus suber TaxID=58331 RepID=UPI000CE27C82|nr:receptor-like serine/threonine-protein kinase At1g78530 [Quercus suber]